MKESYSLLADCVVVVHFLYVLFVVGGLVVILLGAGFGWKRIRNPSFRISHLVAVGLVALEAVTGIACPLTNWEYDLRRLSDGPVDQNVSFLARLAHAVLFYNLPEYVFAVVHVVFGLLVVATFILVPPWFESRK
jgi:hypothetical protein